MLDLWRGRLSLRRLRVLVDNLPAESAYKRAKSVGGMTDHELIVMGLFNLTQAANYHRLVLGGEEQAEPPTALYPPGAARPEHRKSKREIALEKAAQFKARQQPSN